MTVVLYTICWNEADMLGFFFRHYDPWVDRYVIYDDGSDDGSLELLQRHPKVEVRRFARTVEDSFVLSHRALHNEAWKESRGVADWVVITAIDEHLELAGGGNQRDYLDQCRRDGVTLVPGIGYQMISRRFPRPDWRLASVVTQGAPFHYMNKLSILDPDRIDISDFNPGRHLARPSGTLHFPSEDRMMVLHYKYLDFDRTLRRQNALRLRLGSQDIGNRWGYQYWLNRQSTWDTWRAFERQAIDIAAPGFRPDQPGCFDGDLWWRKPEAAA